MVLGATPYARVPRRREYFGCAVPAYFMHVESAIKWLMDEIFALAKSGEDDDEKMRLVAMEYRARLVLERYRKLNAN